jgi:hypothetical protein
MLPDFGVWVKVKQDSEVGTFLVHGPESLMRGIFGNIVEEVPKKLALRLAGCHWRQSCWWIVEFRCHGCCFGGW